MPTTSPELRQKPRGASSPLTSDELTGPGQPRALNAPRVRADGSRHAPKENWPRWCKQPRETQARRQREATRPNEHLGSDGRVMFARRDGFPCEMQAGRLAAIAQTKAEALL